MTTLLKNRVHRATEHSQRPPAWEALLRAATDGLRLLADRVGNCAAAWQRRSRAAASERALRALDDRTLHDLGFHRSEIMSIARDPADLSRARSAWSC